MSRDRRAGRFPQRSLRFSPAMRAPGGCDSLLASFEGPEPPQIIFLISAAKPPLTLVLLRRFRFRFCDFLVRMWFFIEWLRRTLPPAVSLKRFAAPR